MRFLAFLAMILACGPVFAEEATPEGPASLDKNNASILLRWIDAHGQLFSGGTVTKMAWVWAKATEDDKIESPALRLWVSSRLPADWVPQRITADGVSVFEPFREGRVQTLALDLRTSHGTLRFEFRTATGQTVEMTLAVSITVNRPYILVRQECNKYDLKFMAHKVDAHHLFVGLSCQDLGDAYDIYFFRSKDSTWNPGPGLVQFDPEGRFTAFKYHVPKPKTQIVYSQRLFRVGTIDDLQRPTEYSVFYFPKLRPNAFYVSAGMGTSIYNYQEQLGGLHLSQVSLTGKVNVGYRLIPRILDIAMNTFGNVLTITHSSNTGVPDAHFYGVNGRLGYRLPIDIGAVEFMFLTGMYFWGMIVNAPDDAHNFGIKALSGPQLFLTMINSQAGHAGWWGYFKFAMIADRFTINNFSNRELAVGTGFELSARETKPFSITLDIAQAVFSKGPTATAPGNGMKLLSVTAGVQKSF